MSIKKSGANTTEMATSIIKYRHLFEYTSINKHLPPMIIQNLSHKHDSLTKKKTEIKNGTQNFTLYRQAILKP